jgi:3-deoxy-D-manno-octulosonate 8-phosphate phosphatase (KDO 8-P phosphatase)
VLYTKLKRIKAVLMDVDGVLTAGNIIFSENGDELKFFNVQDGLGITMLRKAGAITGIITGRESRIVRRRYEELKMDFISMGHFSKLEPLEKFLSEYKIQPEEVAYIGDDILDLPVLSRVGFAAAPANAREELKPYLDYLCHASGGEGAVREFADLLLKTQGKYNTIFSELAQFPPSEPE